MGDFHRSPSKVWWPEEYQHSPRRSSASPGSQDSGFSDTENSPPAPRQPLEQRGEVPKTKEAAQRLPNDILKNNSEEDSIKSQNLSVNFKQKFSPKKSIALQLSESGNNSCGVTRNRNISFLIPRTPVTHFNNGGVKSEPIKRHRFHRNGSLKVSRSLFRSLPKQSAEDIPVGYQYAEEINDAAESQYSNTSSKVILDNSQLWKSNDNSVELLEGVKTYPLVTDNNFSYALQRNRSAPAILPPNEDRRITSLTEEEYLQSSECESELESTFHGLLDHPKHTSTPKTSTRNFRNMRHHRNKRIARLLAAVAHNNERGPSLNVNEEPASVQKWLHEARELYEPECMTTLQCKSIAIELAQKVAFIATRMTATLRKVLTDSELIITEFDNIKSQKQHTGPLAQSFARLIEEFIKNYVIDADADLLKTCEDIRCSSTEDISKLIVQLNAYWKITQHKVLVREIKNLVNELEDPHSELHVRAAVTGLTSIALRNKEVISIFISSNTIQILCVLCEKCESSTVRSLVLRALATICNNNAAVRQFENASGIQLISETISEETRPEPERSEAVALLAQITAPWIEDNRNVQGLQEQVKVLTKALTHFVSSTKCCQNLLLCTAALANLSEMEPKSIKYILHQNSIGNILKVIKSRGTLVSVYLLEQVATLIANLSLRVNARKLLIEEQAPAALLHFLHCNHTDPDIESRLQQKCVIALSRLSSDPEAAQQIVKCDGVSRLVRLCRERKERYDNDAVLVAALATLRKIAEACGNTVIDTLDIQELVEPRLLDSFLAYSTQNESYV